ncbi:MAG: hypothetical protein WC654_05825 [Patescibacteria group bacterium]
MFKLFFPLLSWLYAQVTFNRCLMVVRFWMIVSLATFRGICLFGSAVLLLYSLVAGLVLGGLPGAVLMFLLLLIVNVLLNWQFPLFMVVATDLPIRFMHTRYAERLESRLAANLYNPSTKAFMMGCEILSSADQRLRHLRTWWFLTRLELGRRFWSAWYHRPHIPTMSLVTTIPMIAVTPIAAVASPLWIVVWPSLALALLIVDTLSAHAKVQERLAMFTLPLA